MAKATIHFISETKYVQCPFGELEQGEIFVRQATINKPDPCPHICIAGATDSSGKRVRAISLRSGCHTMIEETESVYVCDAIFNIQLVVKD